MARIGATMKLREWILLIGLVAMFGFGIVTLYQWHEQDKIIPTMIATCEKSYGKVDGRLEQDCGNLIDKVQKNGFEVLNDENGKFWVEWNPTANQPQ